MKVSIGMTILIIVGIASLIYWHKKIDSETTWIYGIYVIIQLILSLFVLKAFELFWTTQA